MPAAIACCRRLITSPRTCTTCCRSAARSRSLAAGITGFRRSPATCTTNGSARRTPGPRSRASLRCSSRSISSALPASRAAMSTTRMPSRLEPHLVDRLLHLGLRHPDLLLRPVRSFRQEAGGRQQPVGRGRDHARMDLVLAAAVPSVRDLAADQIMSLVREGADYLGIAEAEPSLASAGDYLALLKPRVMSLVVFTALTGIAIAPAHIHPLIGFTALLCIAVGAGAAGALNMWYDAD